MSLKIEETTLGEFKRECKKEGITWPHILQPNFKFPYQVIEECEVKSKSVFPQDEKKQKIWFWHRYSKECRQRGWGGWIKQQLKEKLNVI